MQPFCSEPVSWRRRWKERGFTPPFHSYKTGSERQSAFLRSVTSFSWGQDPVGLAPSLATHSAASLARCPPGSQVFGEGSGVLLLGAGAHSPELRAVDSPDSLCF